MPFSPLGQWTPDQGDFQNPGATIAKNVVPRTSTSYGPIKALSAASNAVAARPQGAMGFKANDGTVHSFCGDASDLYKFNSGTIAWDEISVSTGAYTVASDDAVNFVQFGDRVISVNGHTDQPQSYVMGTSTEFAVLAAASPRARIVGVIKDFVMMGDTWDGTDGAVSNRVWWCAQDDPTDWPTIASTDASEKQSDRQDLRVGGRVRAILGAVGGLDGAIISEEAIHRVQYEGPPTVFGFYPVEEARGTIAANSVINVGPVALYLGKEGFYLFNGVSSTAIGDDRVDGWFQERLNTSYHDRVYGVADTTNKLAFWAFPSTDSTEGRPDSLIIYNWTIDQWSYAEVDMELLYTDLAAGYTLEGLDNVSASIDALPASLDSDSWKGGLLALSAFDTDYKMARFTGDNMAATMETTELGGPNMTLFDGIRPVVDGGTITVGLKTRNLPTDTVTTFGPNAIDSDGQAHFNVEARYGRAQINVASGGAWTHAQGLDYEVKPGSVI